MADRLNRVLGLLQPAPLPVDLIDNPYRTDQWLSTVNTLHQAVLVLLADAASGAVPAGRAPESRGDRLMRRFRGLTDGLPVACLSGVPPVAKLGLLRPLLADLEARVRRIAEQNNIDASAIEARLRQYRAALGIMATRLAISAEAGPAGLRQPVTVSGH